MNIFPYCYNIEKGTEFFVGYFDEVKKRNTLLKCTAIGEHNHIQFKDYGYGYGAYTEVKVETALGIRHITLIYDMSNNEGGQHYMANYPTLGIYVCHEAKTRVRLYKSIEDYKNGDEMYISPMSLKGYYIDTRGYRAYNGTINLCGKHNCFLYYYISKEDGEVRKTSTTCYCYRLDTTAKKLALVDNNTEKGGYFLWIILSEHPTRFATEIEAIKAAHNDVEIIGADFTATKIEKSTKDKLTEWVQNQAVSVAELKKIVEEL